MAAHGQPELFGRGLRQFHSLELGLQVVHRLVDMGIPTHAISRDPDAAQILIVGAIAEPAAHLHQRVIHDRVAQEVADCQPLQRQAARQGETANRDDGHAVFPGLVIVQRLRSFRSVHFDHPGGNQNLMEPRLHIGPVSIIRVFLLPYRMQLGYFGIVQRGSALASVDGHSVTDATNHIGHLRPQTSLHIGKSRGVDEHRCVRRLLAARVADRSRDNESTHRLH